MPEILLVGTRDSKLALYQANLVKEKLEALGQKCELVPIKSDGDTNLSTPLYEMGVQGIFTKNLDAALLDNKIDIAVHSMKDVPVTLAKGLTECAVLERDSHYDLCVYRDEKLDLEKELVIGTSSLRRKAQWLNKYPHHKIKPIRGNVQTRLRKLEEGEFDAVIFAEAGLDRLGIKPEKHIRLDWMLPAPAQGAIMVTCRMSDRDIYELCDQMTDRVTYICTYAERQFLATLEAGCTAPVGALAVLNGVRIEFYGTILNKEGLKKLEKHMTVHESDFVEVGNNVAQSLLYKGAASL